MADGNIQNSFYEESQIASPSVSSDALLIVDTHEYRDVAVADVVVVYLKADMNDYTLLKFTGESVDNMCKLNPEEDIVCSKLKGFEWICCQCFNEV